MVARLVTYPLLNRIAPSARMKAASFASSSRWTDVVPVSNRARDDRSRISPSPCGRGCEIRVPQQSQVLVGTQHQHALAVDDYPSSIVPGKFGFEELPVLLFEGGDGRFISS